jgi:methionyl-tRNA formyltransferase
MRIAVAGTGNLGLSVMQGVEDAGHDLIALVQDGRKMPPGFRRGLMLWVTGTFAAQATVTGYAKRLGIPILFIDKMNETDLEPLRKLDIDLLLVAGFAIILKKPLIELPKIGTVNCHPSLLPLHRGPNPFAAVILAKRTETGVSFHVMEESIDSGDILLQERVELKGIESAGAIYRKTSEMAREMVPPLLEHIETNGLIGTPQDNTLASYEGKLEGEKIVIDWNQPAEEIHRLCMACLPFALPRFRDGGRVIYISRTSFDPERVDEAPGTIIAVRPQTTFTTRSGKEMKTRAHARIATGQGTLTVHTAFALKPIPGPWPGIFFARRAPGYVLKSK